MDEQKMSVRELEAKAREEAQSLVDEVKALVPEGFELQRIYSGNYSFCFLIRAENKDIYTTTTTFDNVVDIPMYVNNAVIRLSGKIASQEKTAEIQRLIPIPELEPEHELEQGL